MQIHIQKTQNSYTRNSNSSLLSLRMSKSSTTTRQRMLDTHKKYTIKGDRQIKPMNHKA